MICTQNGTLSAGGRGQKVICSKYVNGNCTSTEHCAFNNNLTLKDHVSALLKAGIFYPSAIESDSETLRDFEGFDEWEIKVKELLK